MQLITRRTFARLLSLGAPSVTYAAVVEAKAPPQPPRTPPGKKPMNNTLVVTRGNDFTRRTWPVNANSTMPDPTKGTAKLSAKDRAYINTILPDATCVAGIDAANGNVFYVDITWTHAQTLQYGALNHPSTFGVAKLVWTVTADGTEWPLGTFVVQIEPNTTAP